MVTQSHAQSRMTDGTRRIREELLATGETISRERVACLMRQQGLASQVMRKFKATTDSHPDRPVAPHRLDRDLQADWPHQAYVGDITDTTEPVRRPNRRSSNLSRCSITVSDAMQRLAIGHPHHMRKVIIRPRDFVSGKGLPDHRLPQLESRVGLPGTVDGLHDGSIVPLLRSGRLPVSIR
jgi:transposase InsO family protein